MRAARVDAELQDLLDADAAVWRRVPQERIELQKTILALQPSEYVQTKWATAGYGVTPEVRVAAAHNGSDICFRLEWNDSTDDGQPDDMSEFPDQAAVMMPIKEDAPIAEMGMPDQPVNMWLWRGDADPPLYVTASGRGTTVRHKESPLAGRGSWRDGVWRVVIARPFNVSLPAGAVVPLAPGVSHKCTFAVWEGSRQERGGLKAFQQLWQPLEIEQ